jgi:hypothetical protein
MNSENPSQPTPSGAERRRQPRRAAEWPVTLCLPEGYFDARLRDVSSAGACFHLDRPVAEMTALALQLDLPAEDGPRRVHGTGVVVRCRRVSPVLDHYEIAVFFHQISSDDRVALEQYVASQPS